MFLRLTWEGIEHDADVTPEGKDAWEFVVARIAGGHSVAAVAGPSLALH